MSSFANYDLENGEVPAHYYCQCQHYMLVKGYDKVHDLTELAVLGIVILLRALLAFLIHWEMKAERKDDEEKAKAEKEKDAE